MNRYKSGLAELVAKHGALKKNFGVLIPGMPANKTWYEVTETASDVARKVEEPAKKATLFGLMLAAVSGFLGFGCTSKAKEAGQRTSASATCNTNQTTTIRSLDEILKKPSCREHNSLNFNKGRSGKQISLIVLHTTESSASSAESWLCNAQKEKAPKERQRVSAHYLLNKKGQLVQLVKEENTAWHCRRYNERAIGIEMEGTYKERITEKQKSTLVQLLSHLLNKYNISINAIKAHSELDPGRKLDPGKENMELVLSSLNGYISNLFVAAADKDRLLGAARDKYLASASPTPASNRTLADDVVYAAATYEFTKDDKNAWQIARRYGIDWDEFKAANPAPAKTNFTRLHYGDKLNIPEWKLKRGEIDIRYMPNQLEASITIEEIQQQINKFKSSMSAQHIYDTAIKYGIDPRFIAALCRNESGFATAGKGKRDNNPGNINVGGKPGIFATREAGTVELCRKLRDEYILNGRYTAESIIKIYAPAYDGNNVDAYIAFVREQYGRSPSEIIASMNKLTCAASAHN